MCSDTAWNIPCCVVVSTSISGEGPLLVAGSWGTTVLREEWSCNVKGGIEKYLTAFFSYTHVHACTHEYMQHTALSYPNTALCSYTDTLDLVQLPIKVVLLFSYSDVHFKALATNI